MHKFLYDHVSSSVSSEIVSTARRKPQFTLGKRRANLATVNRLSIIIPVLNESRALAGQLPALQSLRTAGHELILVDGGSTDGSYQHSQNQIDQLLRTEAGRALQMNAGAAVARGDVLLFLHVDTELPPGAAATVLDGLNRSGCSWGRFDVRLTGAHPAFRLIEFMMNLRSRLSGIATGDQALFVRRDAFESVGGFASVALMEDVLISSALKTLGRPLCLRERVRSSSRRWERHGIVRTVWLMWRLRLAFFLGANPSDLHRRYYRSALQGVHGNQKSQQNRHGRGDV
jgi:rSAM/selenodomain-associated transferase 2